MATPVEVSLIKRSVKNPSLVEGVGGKDKEEYRFWYLSERNLIAAIEQPARQWDFFVVIVGQNVPLTVDLVDGRKRIMAAGTPLSHLPLAAWRDFDELGWPIPVE
jgi:hypothetical protein